MHKSLRVSGIKSFVLKILGFFIPYFKRMLTRQTVIDTVNQMLSQVLNKEGYYHNTELALTSDQGIHKILSEVQLLCGRRLKVEVLYKNSTVMVGVKVGEHDTLNNADLLEMAKVSGIIEKINTGALVTVFESYKP